MSTISTGFAALDALLGGKGFLPRSKVLLCGAPGTGKTTFAWHLVAELLGDNPNRNFVQFCAFEEPARRSFKRFVDSHDQSNHSAILRALDVGRMVDDGAWNVSNLPEPARGSMVLRDAFPKPSKKHTHPVEYFRDVARWTHLARGAGYPMTYLLVIDGLNALIDWTLINFPTSNPRELMRILESSFRVGRLSSNSGQIAALKPMGPTMILMTAEDKPDRGGRWSESYMADVVVDLRYEPFMPDPMRPDYEEWRRTCRVLKGRGLHVQRRSVVYDFTKDSGIAFFEVYAASGIARLFVENHRQEADIETFSSTEKRVFFPRVRIDKFTRDNMYDEYTARLQAVEKPHRREMVLSHADEYWPTAMLAAPKPLLERIPLRGLTLFDPPGSPFIRELNEKLQALPGFIENMDGDELYAAIPYALNVSFLVRKLSDSNLGAIDAPTTWENVEEVCREKKAQSPASFPLLLETKTIDTLVVFLLELFWSHGAGWITRIMPGTRDTLEIEFQPGHAEANAPAALERFRSWFVNGFVRPHSTVDPRHASNAGAGEEWVFARHWYSTFIDYLYASSNQGRETGHHSFGITPLPPAAGWEGGGVSSWGEWYLTMDAGTENKQLGYKIIETLLTSKNVMRRAVTGAGLPVFERFYEEFGDAECFGTNSTFAEVRRLLGSAISRARFARYRFVMQRIYAVAFTIMSNPAALDGNEAWRRLRQAIA